MAFIPRKPKAGDFGPEHSARLRFSSLLAACFLVLAAVALAYVAGVMSGRAYSSRQSVAASASPAAPGAGDSQDPGMAPAPENSEKDPQILAPEELRFARALRGRAGEAAVQEPARQPGGAAQPAQGGGAAQAAAGSPAYQPAIPPSTAQPSVPGAETPAPQVANPAALFDYVFQVAAFKDEDSVDALRQRLEGRGFRTRMQRDGKLYLVFVLLRGDAARAAEVPHIMHEMQLGEPIVRSRKPAL